MMFGSGMMEHGSAWHLILMIISAALILYPIGRILGRIGFSPLWSLVALLPFLNLIGLWVLAMIPWPNHDPLRR